VPPLDGVSDESAVVRARQIDGALEWESNTDAVPILHSLLRLDDDLDTIVDAMPDEPLVERAYGAYPGMRIVRDPPFGCLVSFICSAQMRVSRIFDMQERLREAYGEAVEFDGNTYRAYPTPERLADATEDDLRDLRLGYRAPYVQRTAEMVASGEATPAAARGLDYEAARDYLTQFVGVGDKVADCVLLFSLDYLEAVPLDTWIHTAIDEYYPECDHGNYRETSRAIRERLGGDVAGYTQTYVFHYLRSGGQ
jgi:N-glycosylase/DNA lyase